MFVFVLAGDAASRSRAAAVAAEATVEAYAQALPTTLDRWYSDGALEEVHGVASPADLYAVGDFADDLDYLSVLRGRGSEGEKHSTISFIGAKGKGKIVVRAMQESR